MPKDFPLLVKELQTRFLYPFFFDGRDLKAVSAKLQAMKSATILASSTKEMRDGRAAKNLKICELEETGIWRCAPPPASYADEVLNHVKEFLFAADSKTCEYLKLAPEVLNAIFHHHYVTIQLSRDAALPLKFIPKIGIELFLTSHDVGVMTIGLMPARENLTFSQVVDFNYRLARFEPMPPALLRIPHPQTDAAKWARIPEFERERIPPPPPPDAPLIERLDAAGGAFTLPELIEALLKKPLNEFRLKDAQAGLSVYTIARLDAQANFNEAETRAKYARLISALAQVEESAHAGTDAVSVADAVLNQKHWAAVGLLGAAHLVADQATDESEAAHPFNEQRVPRVRDKYFVPFLMAILQRLFLDQTIRRATKITEHMTTEHKEAARRELGRLRDAILQFAIAGHFVQVSSRESLHRFYRIAQQGLDVPDAWAEVRFAISDMDRKFAAEREYHLSQVMSDNLTAINHVQKVIHIIEYIVVGTYLAEVWHLFAEGYFTEESFERVGWGKDRFISIMTLVVFAAGFVVAKFVNWLVRREESEEKER